MKTIIHRQPILDLLTLATKFNSNKLSSLSSLQGILIEGKNGEINFYSTNLNLFFHGSILSETPTPFKIIIEPKKIMEFLTLLKEEQIEMEVKETAITLTQKNTKGNFPLLKAADFPPPPEIKEKEQKISNELFLKNLPLVLFAAAKEETRPVLSGINFLVVDNDICLVATDGFRLSLIKSKKEGDFPNILIPAAFLDEVFRQTKEKKEVYFNYSKEEKAIMFRVGRNRFYSRLIEGEFPPYEKVIPAEKKTTIILDKNELLRNIKIISVFAREASNIVICDFVKGRLFMKPKIDGGGENSAEQEVEQSGEDQKIAFNYRFVIDFLNNVGGEKIIIEILRADAPAVFKMEKNDNFLHIIMPVRLQE